ncbi:uncharacterized protein [Trachinotus anak]|uniref:uncharacterized protein isoform X2 n=1 Tax=Trachinotus anak TaxID=443729 RepID=UPI0039F1DCCA
MRGLTLLCLIGLILTTHQDYRKCSTPMGNEDGFNTTTNSSTVPEETSVNNETAQWNGTRERIDNNYGFPPSSAEGEDTKLPKGDTATSDDKKEPTKPSGSWHFLGNHDGFLPEPTGGNGVQDSPKFSTPMGNEDGFNTTTNSSTVPVVTSVNNETAQWNGTRERIDNNYGFPPSSAEGEDTKGNTKE